MKTSKYNGKGRATYWGSRDELPKCSLKFKI